MNKIMKRCIALILTFILSATAVPMQSTLWAAQRSISHTQTTDINMQDTHKDINYGDMKYKKYKPKRFYTLIKKAEKLCKTSGNEKQLMHLYDKILEEFDIMYTSMQINDIHYYKDNTNQYYVEQQTYCKELSEKMNDQICTLVKHIADSEYKEAFEKKAGSNMIEEYKDYKPLTEKQKKLSKLERKLVQEYDTKIMKRYAVTVDGTSWTEEKLNSDESLSYEKYIDIYTQLEKKKNQAAGNIFVKLVKVRTQIAKSYGYDNYADYAYEEGYHRDYTTKDTEELHDLVQDYLAPVWLQMQMNWTADDQSKLADIHFTEEEVMENLGTYISAVSDQFIPAYNYMTEHHLYDIAPEDTKMDIGYTTEFAAYQAPFIFYKPNESYWDMKTMIHEFGHYYNFYQTEESAFYDGTSLDLAEVHSQGLEMLCLDYFDDIYKDAADSVEKVQFIDMLSSVVEGCIYDEFQIKVYENPDMSLKEMNQLMRVIGDSYHYPYYENSDEAYGWVDVSHTFQSPLYYISYATSALGALDLWKMSLENRDKAVQTYLNLANAGTGVEFGSALEENGLQDIFSEAYIKELADVISETYIGKDGHTEEAETTMGVVGKSLPARSNGLVIGAAAIGIVVLLILALVIVQRKRRKRYFDE